MRLLESAQLEMGVVAKPEAGMRRREMSAALAWRHGMKILLLLRRPRRGA